MTISQLNPELLWRHFSEICAIPHPSGHEDGIRRYLKTFAGKQKLEFDTDPAGNILIQRPAFPGYENTPKIILQGHMDMVPQKNAATDFDFESDSIQPYVDGNWVKAKGTTLGSDNGIGMSAALAVLEDTATPTGPIAALFTTEEETGLTGAMNVIDRFLEADILLNLDSEEDGRACIGCAGGARTDFLLNFDREPLPETGVVTLRIELSGLRGGHSGIDINLNRGNANKIMASLLRKAAEKFEIRLMSLNGGNLDNAIPREANAEIIIHPDMEMEFAQWTEEFCEDCLAKLGDRDPGLKILLHKDAVTNNVLAAPVQESILTLLNECPNGVITMSSDVEGLVETSTNLAAVKTEGDILKVTTSQRSLIDSERDRLVDSLAKLFESRGAETIRRGSYPGWAPNLESNLVKVLGDTYHELFGKELIIEVIHAGLECGCFKGVNPDIEMISFGPDIESPHSPDERVSISSVQRFMQLLKRVIEKIQTTG